MPCIDSVYKNLKKMDKKDDLVINRKGGGSVIDRKPLFSPCGSTIFVIWKQVIRAYSVQTGELIRDYDGLSGTAVSVEIHPHNPKILIACSEQRELITWKSGIQISKTEVAIEDAGSSIKTFHLISRINDTCEALLTWTAKHKKKPNIGIFNINTGQMTTKIAITGLSNSDYKVSVGGSTGNKFFSIIQDKYLYNYSLSDMKVVSTYISITSTMFTCVLCHPEDYAVLTGDSIGQVIMWRRIISKKPVKTVFHWHTLPVVCLAFTQAAQHFYSGGNECTLVKWRTDNPNERSYLPRLPAPLCHIAVGCENLTIAVSTRDNAIQLVDSHNRVKCNIQHFSWGITTSSDPKLSPSTTNEPPFSAGMCYDPSTQAVVLNGRTGHVQFYSTKSKSLLYNVDITNENRRTAERQLEIINTSVILLAIGTLPGQNYWMATVEHRDDKVSHFESRLKFWHYDSTKQTYSLNTCVDLPHEGRVLCLEFQTSYANASSQSLLCATCGSDDKVKIWSLEKSNNVNQKNKQYWRCIGVAHYKHLPVQTLAFSTDGTLLACGFGSSVTVWTPEDFNLKCSLTQFGNDSQIKKLLFGKEDEGHLLLSCNETHLTVWNLLTLCATWTVKLSVNILTSDPLSTYVAAFTNDKKLYIFTANDSTPVYKKDLSSIGQTLTAVWVPNTAKRNFAQEEWQYYSHLYFLDENQELLCLEHDYEDELIKTAAIASFSEAPLTPFGALVASHQISMVKQTNGNIHSYVGVPGAEVIKELLIPASHMMPPPHLLCGDLLRSLLGAPKPVNPEPQENGVEKVDSQSDSDSETVLPSKDLSKKDSSIVKPKSNLRVDDIENDLKHVIEESNSWAANLVV